MELRKEKYENLLTSKAGKKHQKKRPVTERIAFLERSSDSTV